jgi:hypothetical protein
MGQDKCSLEDDKLRSSDRHFLQIWVDDYADDPAWEKLVADGRRFQKSPMFDHIWLIWCVLRARRAAEDAGSGVDPLDEERKKRREELLDLAKSADDLAAFWREAEGRCAFAADKFATVANLPPATVCRLSAKNAPRKSSRMFWRARRAASVSRTRR